MTNFAILSRVKEMLRKKEPPQKAVEKPSYGKVAMVDPEKGTVVKEFDSIDSAVNEGFNLPNIVGAIRSGHKYKGHLWTAENELT